MKTLNLLKIMGNLKDILKDFDKLAAARKKNALVTKLAFALCAFTVAAVLFFCYRTVGSVAGKILVVNEGGGFLPLKAVDQGRLYESLLKAHCASVVYYLNSFDRLSMQDNQARALFLVDRTDANTVFAKYQADRAYGDVLDLGVVYKTEFEKVSALTVHGEEYHVTFTAVLKIINGEDTKKVLITATGTAIRTTPRYPENMTGFFFKTYNQNYKIL